jgi:hypothetical protein
MEFRLGNNFLLTTGVQYRINATIEGKMKAMPKLLLVEVAVILATQAQAVMYQLRPYEPNMARWLTRDPIGEDGGLNLYGFVGNDAVNKADDLGLACACKCKKVKVSFSPSTIFGNMKIGFYSGPGGEEFGSVITIAWTVDGDPTKCKYYLYEPPGGVNGSGPSGTFGSSYGTLGLTVPVGQVYNDHMGLPVGQNGKYKIQVDLSQTYTCESDDGTTVTETKTYKKNASGKW